MTRQSSRKKQHRRPEPLVQPESELFWKKAREHSLWLKRCIDCDVAFFYPRDICPRCASRKTDWIESSGKGILYSFAIVHRAPAPAFDDEVPYVIALVELEEGARLPTNLVGVPCEPAAIRIGMKVEAVFDEISAERTLVRFRPSGDVG